MRGSLVGLGAAVVVAAAAVLVAMTVAEPPVAGSPVAADVPPATAPSPAEPPTRSSVAPACAGELAGSGSSLARNAVMDVAAELERTCPDTVVDYSPVGSGAGLEQFTSGATGMAVVDRAPSGSELAPLRARCEAQTYPFVVHPVMVRYHIAGVGELNLDAPTLTKIFSGTVTRWNDPSIVRQNPDSALSARPIVVVGRGDESSTTAAFQQYLAVAGGWAGGTDTTFTGKATQTAQGDSGMLAMIENTEGAIGYLTAAEGTRSQVLRLGGVAPAPAAVTTTITSALPAGGLALDPADVYGADPAAGAYPLVIVSYALVCADDAAARDFLLASLTVQDRGTEYVFPAGEWAGRLVDALE